LIYIRGGPAPEDRDRPEYVATAFVLNVKGAAPTGADPSRPCSKVGEDRTRPPLPARQTLMVQLRSD